MFICQRRYVIANFARQFRVNHAHVDVIIFLQRVCGALSDENAFHMSTLERL